MFGGSVPQTSANSVSELTLDQIDFDWVKN